MKQLGSGIKKGLNRNSFLFLLFLLLLTTPFNTKYSQNLEYSYTQFSHCYDGDTCTIVLPNRAKVRVRLACVDAPEISKGGQRFSKEAKSFINGYLKHSKAYISMTSLDPYRRPIVYIHKSGLNLNHLLLKKGLAVVYKGKTTYSKKECYKAELLARANNRGLWSLNTFVSPKEFRKKKN